MTYAATQLGLYFPMRTVYFPGASNATALNAAGTQSVMLGHVYWEGRASSKVVSSAGGQIKWFPGTSTTFSNAGTSIDVGIQDVDAVNGQPVRGDGTFDVKGTLVGGTATITDNAWNTVSMSTGSKTIAQGDLVAIVLNMVSRGGSDVVRTTSTPGPGGTISSRPTMSEFTSSAWRQTGGVPNAYIIADDGTLGVFRATLPFTSVGSEAYGDGTNPDERALAFQVPWDCKIDGLFGAIGGANANGDGTLAVYSDPFGTPATISGTSVTILGENFDRASSAFWFEVGLPAEVSLSKNTDYCVALRGTGSANLSLAQTTLPDTNLRKFITGGTTIKKVTRNNGSGAFTAESPAVTIYCLGICISSFIDSAGGAAGAGFSGAFVG